MNSALLEKELNRASFSGEEDMRQYLSEIRRYPRLSSEQEQVYALPQCQPSVEPVLPSPLC